MNKIFTKPLDAGAAVKSYRFVKFGANENKVVQAAAATDKIIGAVNMVAPPGSNADAGDRLDVEVIGFAEIQCGGNVAFGDLVTSDADGRAVTAAPAVGVNNRIGGIAWDSGVLNDIILVMLTPVSLQG